MRRRYITEPAIILRNHFQPFVLTPVLMTGQCLQHFLYQIINVKKCQLRRLIIDLRRKIIRNVIAECRNRAVVVRAAPLSKDVRETVNQYLCTGIFGIPESQLLTGQLCLAISGTGKASCEESLRGTGQHDRASVSCVTKHLQKSLKRIQIAGHVVFRPFRAVDAGQMEDKIRFPTIFMLFFLNTHISRISYSCIFFIFQYMYSCIFFLIMLCNF